MQAAQHDNRRQGRRERAVLERTTQSIMKELAATASSYDGSGSGGRRTWSSGRGGEAVARARSTRWCEATAWFCGIHGSCGRAGAGGRRRRGRRERSRGAELTEEGGRALEGEEDRDEGKGDRVEAPGGAEGTREGSKMAVGRGEG